MKKTYKKPLLVVERFAFSQNIANICGDRVSLGSPNLASKETCGWDVFGSELFQSSYICDIPTEDLEGVCYNAPEGGYNIFGS